MSSAPDWAVATAQRLDCHARPRRPGTAALRRGVPAQEAAAAAMLADDLAAVGADLPRRAWEAARSAGSRNS